MIDYSKFLARPDESRSYLQKPFMVDGGAAFTNGHIFVLVEGLTPEDVSEPPGKVVPNINEWAKEAMSADKYLALPDEINWDQFTCDECGGSGKRKKCRECDGSGVLELESDYNDYTVDCKSCESNPDHICMDCRGVGIGGLGRTGNLPVADLNGEVTVDAGYLKMMTELPDLRIAAPIKSETMVKFRFNGGCGGLMPIRAGEKGIKRLIALKEVAQ